MSPTVDRERNFAPSHQHTFICIHSRQWMELYNKPSRGSFKVGWNGNGMGLAGPGNMHLWTTGFLMNKIVQPLTLATLPPSAFEWNFLFMSSLRGADSISVMFSPYSLLGNETTGGRRNIRIPKMRQGPTDCWGERVRLLPRRLIFE